MLHRIVLILVLLYSAPASAHGEFAWIQQRDQRVGDSCCGEHDCFKVLPAAGPKGWVFAHAGVSYFVPYNEAKPSEDGEYWACIPSPGKLRCFFAPPHGS